MELQVTVGCDPELFLRDRATGLPVSAFGLIPGTKHEPYEVPDGMVQVDGMALELGCTPSTTAQQFDSSIVSVLATLRGMVPDTLAFDISPSIVFPDAVLDAMPDDAKVLGCDPDYNAYSFDENPRPVPPIPGLRTASGHIHVGLGFFDDYRGRAHFEQMAKLVRTMDRFVGTASVLMDPDTTRRQLYGRAGAFRVKPYGCEYRVPSNAWLKSSRRRRVMFTLVNRTIQHLIDGSDTHDVIDRDVRQAIDASDVRECRAILKFMLS